MITETTFTDWLIEVYSKQHDLTDTEVVIFKMVKNTGSSEYVDLVEPFEGTIFEHDFNNLWMEYKRYLQFEPEIRACPSDTCTRKVTDIVDGFSLWRCRNRAGTPYSGIRNSKGKEIMSLPTDREGDLLKSFIEGLPMLKRIYNKK